MSMKPFKKILESDIKLEKKLFHPTVLISFLTGPQVAPSCLKSALNLHASIPGSNWYTQEFPNLYKNEEQVII